MASPITYSTNSDIKIFAGLTGNPYIVDEVYDAHRLRAKGRINTVLASKYALPIPETGVVDALALLSQIEIYLAGGAILWQEYGKEAIGTDKDGMEKIRQGEAMLREIQRGEMILIADDGTAFQASGDNASPDSLSPSGDTDTEYMFGRDTSDI